jgi:hypothetical protein
MPLARRSAFLTAGCPENEGACNCRAVARSLLGLVCMTCGAWPPCHKVGFLAHVGGDFTCDASGARAGRYAFKKGSISQAVVMPRSSCDHRALSPSGPPDGVRRCSLEGSASRPSLPTTSPSESVHSWWCRRSCLLSTAVGGVQPHGSWHPSTTIWLQGFSSCSPTAVPRRWSSRRMTTSLVVGRSKPGCSLPPALSFKDVHHPCWGGGCAELGPAFAWVAARFFPQCSGEKGVRRLWRCQLQLAWLPGLGSSGAASGAASYRWGGAWLPVHRMSDGRAVCGLATSTASPAAPVVLGGRTRRRTPCGWGQRSWMVLSSLP